MRHPNVSQALHPIVATNQRDPVPAAQYVRMSDDTQQYSVENQKLAIQEYAACHGFTIVKTYADLGKSGVEARHRSGLGELLRDVVSGIVPYKAILVYDVSRWGRFPNNDEAAYYEFVCSSSGIPLHYCAEPFANDGSATSSLLKALKRSMAAEFSRELGEKVFRGKTRIVQLGYWVGGPPGFGYRRLMVSASGKPKQRMKPGEHKSLTTDRVILIPGPKRETDAVRLMFSMAAAGKGCEEIAQELNRRGVDHAGKSWRFQSVKAVLRNPKYMGCNVWSRSSQRLRGKKTSVDPQLWVRKELAFTPIVDEKTFTRAQSNVYLRKQWTREEILKRIRRLLEVEGRLSVDLMIKARNMPCTTTILKRFGRYRDLYELVGYKLARKHILNTVKADHSFDLRRDLVAKLLNLFPGHVEERHFSRSPRPILLVDNELMISVLLCRLRQNSLGDWCWRVDPYPTERGYATLICLMNPRHSQILGYYLFPPIPWKSHLLFRNDPTLKSAIRLDNLADFYGAAKRLRAAIPTNTWREIHMDGRGRYFIIEKEKQLQ